MSRHNWLRRTINESAANVLINVLLEDEKKMIYKQCWLKRKISDNATEYTTSYLPIKFAVVGEVVRLRDNGVWTDGWVVEFAGHEIEEGDLPDAHKSIKQHRRNTGDALPKNTPGEDCY